MNTFKQRIQSRKGEIAERIVDAYLRQLGYMIYSPIVDGPHPIDRICALPNKRLFFVDIKTKKRREKYDDTGMDLQDYYEYNQLMKQHNIPICLIWVDDHEKEQRVYGRKLETLNKPITINGIKYPLEKPNHSWKGIVYFPLQIMKHLKNLTPIELKQLRAQSHRDSYHDQIRT